MALVTVKEIAKVTRLDKYGVLGTLVSWILMRLLRIHKMNTIYNRNKHLSGVAFLNALLNEFGIKFDLPEDDFKRLPKEGAYITISNHPLGGIDGILLLKLMLEKVPEYKIIANFLLQRIDPMKPYILAVNPFEDHKDAKSNISGIKETLKHLANGKPVGLFPAGEVSTYKDGKIVVDKDWEEGAIKLIKKANVPVVPIYFHAKNSNLFYYLSQLGDNLRTAKLPSELLAQKRRVIKVRIGKPISVEEQQKFTNLEDYAEFLRKKTYILSNAFIKGNRLLIGPNFRLTKIPRKIAKPTNQAMILEEIIVLRNQDNQLLKSKNYEVYLAEAREIPNILREVGRLREITFRSVGEGTNKSLDLDSYDKYYRHLFLWDDEAQKIAGAYRMGLGSEIFPKYGIDGFYLTDLFGFESALYPFMEQAIEMGRAFIINEYQQKTMPLFLLWKGIIHTTLRFPEHKYLIGGVSISNEFSDFSKSLMIDFMRSHFFDAYVAQYIKPKKEYKVKIKEDDKNFISEETQSDLNKFDKIINEIEPNNLRLPVLIKKYIKQNAKVLAFNVDPLFNHAIDSLMYIEITNLPESTVKPIMEEFQRKLERENRE